MLEAPVRNVGASLLDVYSHAQIVGNCSTQLRPHLSWRIRFVALQASELAAFHCKVLEKS